LTIAPTAVDVAAPDRRRWILVATIIGSSMTFIDGTVVNIALPTIGRDLNAGLSAQQWVMLSYSLAVASLYIVSGALGDRYGRWSLFVAGVAGFVLLTGRLAPLIGQSPYANLLAWGCVGLLCLPMLGSLPRIAIAGVPSLMLLSGTAAPILQQVHVPEWFAWGMASLLSVILAARLFVFGVLPTVAACWLVAQIT